MFDAAFQRRLIYIFTIDDEAHAGLLKIGEATSNSKDISKAANERIKQYTNTAGIKFELLHTELAVKNNGGDFHDYDVHRVLKKFKVKIKGTTAREWFKVDLATALNAIKAVKASKKFTAAKKYCEIIFRAEQEDAISRTVEYFKKGNEFLWNAKMRFGKTLCALEVARRMNFSKTIILTHRPVVDAGWFDDFNKIFGGTNYAYGFGDKNFVYFASIQDLRGSETVGGKFDKNDKIFSTDWNLVIVDEAHEGTTTELGEAVIKSIVKENSKLLKLSGTPFNIMEDFSDENTYTWSYIDEQRAKLNCELAGDSNPYADLPAMKIFTYNLAEEFKSYVADMSFNFSEFFKVDGDNFVHEADVQRFLDLLTTADNYPYSRADWRNIFKHTFWIIPGVKEGAALSKLLQRHKIFQHFKIVNAAGSGDGGKVEDIEIVHDAIKNNPYTITLSCGRFTAGVTVPEWTAVFMLKGGSSAADYLQTIFRVQNPCTRGGCVKKICYVFDFAPDRTLRIITEAATISPRAGQTKDKDRRTLDEFLNFCPVIALSGSEMKLYKTDNLLQHLKRAWIERTVRNGFYDTSLYNDELLTLDALDLAKFDTLKKIIGKSKAQEKIADVDINRHGLDNKKTKKPRSPAEIELDRRKAQRRNAISILRGISIRMPLLIYGADIPFDEDFTINMFLDIDDASWAEFMPSGVTKELFSEFIKYYDQDILIGAGRKIRKLAKDADNLTPINRIDKIAALFATFRNPDKETVLTPFNVVKLHIDSAFDESFFTPDKKILDINAKTGLYPLYVAQKIYRGKLANFDENFFKPEILNMFWDKVIADNIFVICKTPMAKAITRRTLLGFRGGSVNAHAFDDLINLLKNKSAQIISQIKSLWNGGGNMFFDAVVGNPPYQIVGSGDNKNFATPVYHLFMENAFKLADKVSLITPARFLFNAGATPKDFIERMLNDTHFKVIDYRIDSKDFFPNTDIKGGVAITLRDANEIFGAIKLFIPFDELISIYKKVVVDNPNFKPLSDIMFGTDIYHWTEQIHIENPNVAARMSKGHEYDISTNAFELLPEIFLDDKPDDGREYVKFIGRAKNRRAIKWLRRDYLKEHKVFYKWKVLIPASNGSGALGEVVSTPLVGSPLVGSPLVGHTSTFISVGAFDSEAEARACMVYIKSKFCRVMLGILKVTQHNPSATWAYVPMQDFTAGNDIDWRGGVDEQLYKKYGLNDAEKKFIESHVKAMT